MGVCCVFVLRPSHWMAPSCPWHLSLGFFFYFLQLQNCLDLTHIRSIFPLAFIGNSHIYKSSKHSIWSATPGKVEKYLDWGSGAVSSSSFSAIVHLETWIEALLSLGFLFPSIKAHFVLIKIKLKTESWKTWYYHLQSEIQSMWLFFFFIVWLPLKTPSFSQCEFPKSKTIFTPQNRNGLRMKKLELILPDLDFSLLFQSGLSVLEKSLELKMRRHWFKSWLWNIKYNYLTTLDFSFLFSKTDNNRSVIFIKMIKLGNMVKMLMGITRE